MKKLSSDNSRIRTLVLIFAAILVTVIVGLAVIGQDDSGLPTAPGPARSTYNTEPTPATPSA